MYLYQDVPEYPNVFVKINPFVCLFVAQTKHDTFGSHFSTERVNSLKWLMAVTRCLDHILEADIDPTTSLPESLMSVHMESMT